MRASPAAAAAAAPPLPARLTAPRLRLTPARPSLAGGAMRAEPVPAPGGAGFETGFTFLISEASRACTTVRDRALSLRSWQVCEADGGDGLAFVLHADRHGSGALGAPAAGMGYEGLRNALVVEFDTHFNAENDDLVYEHVSVQASLGGGVITAGASSRLAPSRRTAIADGLPHVARLRYYPVLPAALAPHLTASPRLLPLLRDGGEAAHIGALVLHVDELDGAPLLALPLNLAALLGSSGDVFAGFTAATGRSWAQHDILDWYWCDQIACSLNGTLPRDAMWATDAAGAAPLRADAPAWADVAAAPIKEG
jgi:hypothetical protein